MRLFIAGTSFLGGSACLLAMYVPPDVRQAGSSAPQKDYCGNRNEGKQERIQEIFGVFLLPLFLWTRLQGFPHIRLYRCQLRAALGQHNSEVEIRE